MVDEAGLPVDRQLIVGPLAEARAGFLSLGSHRVSRNPGTSGK